MSACPESCRSRTSLVLADNTQLLIRRLGPRDRAALAALFARLSEESRYRRYPTPKPRLTVRELVYLTNTDGSDHEAVAAVDPCDGAILGAARYVRTPERSDAAEVAVEVADEFQNQGIGTALAAEVVRRASDRGILVLTASTLWDNGPARSLLRQLGFVARGSRGGIIELELNRGAPRRYR
jgi:RimJ/RimL family protein N-acetyltransferase